MLSTSGSGVWCRDQQHQHRLDICLLGILSPAQHQKPIESETLGVGYSHLWVTTPLVGSDAAQG